MSTEELAEWNDRMVMRYHADGTLFESKNLILRHVEVMRLKQLLRHARINQNDRVLDLGCGEGFLLLFVKKADRVVGMDISRKALEKAKRILKGKNVELKWGNAEDTKFRDKSFTKIVCSETLEHVPNPRKTMGEIHRILDDNGLLVVCIPDEKRIQTLMRIIKMSGLSRFLHAARKQENYEWHLHHSSMSFLKKISRGLFRITKVERSPPLIGYRFVASLRKL